MYSLFKDQNATQLIGSYGSLSAALAAIGRNNTLVLPVSDPFAGVLNIATYGATVTGLGAGATVNLGQDATLFTLGGAQSATIHTGPANTRVCGNDSGISLFGNDGRDIVIGGAGSDRMDGFGGDDVFYGGGGDDILVLHDGRDLAYGGDGADTLFAGEGQNRMTGGAGADTFVLAADTTSQQIIFDFNPGEGDALLITGGGTTSSLSQMLERGGRIYQSGDNAIVLFGDTQIQLRNFDVSNLNDAIIKFQIDISAFPSPADFGISDPAADLTEVAIGDVIYHLRAAEPLHGDFKFIDSRGGWWSPDYFVLVAAGQSNMVGAGKGGDTALHPGIVAYDWFNDALVPADYSAFPAVTREGAAPRNNLYFPAANEIATDMGRPVLVVAHPVSGSRISSWLDSGTGENWAILAPEVARALALVGQTQVDAFFWHQGESDYPVKTADYMGQVQALIAQVRSQPWAPGDLAILLGELSRDGVNFAQNRAYQALEISNTDPNIGFVSSAGLVSDDRNGVHFNGDALVQFGARYAEVLHDIRDGVVADPNTAPTVNLAVPHAMSLTVIEGQELRISIGDYFVDAENDPLYYYSFLDKRNVYMARADQITDELVLTPDFDDAGHYKISLYANDYLLDGETLTIDVTVIQATPLVNTYSNRNFDTQIGSYRDFTVGMDSLSRNRGLEILDQSALSANGPTVITLESLHVRADAAIVGNFILADDVQRAYFYGLGRFDVTGNDLDNYIVGSDGANTVHGGAGLDRIYGNGGADRLFGDDGNDQLFGGSGVDYLDAGPGSDMVYGGGQGDTFVFDRGDQQLQVRDYDGTDTILLRNFAGIADFSDLLASATVRQSASRTIIDISTDRLVIWDMTVDALNADMFGFA